jgi:hypothetical protein
MFGLNAFAYHVDGNNTRAFNDTGSTTYTGMQGGRYATRIDSNGHTITGATGASAYVEILAGHTSTITNAVGFYAEPINAEDGTITSAYSFYATNHKVDTGTLTNSYGLYLNQLTAATNNTQIYSDGGESYLLAGTASLTPLTLRAAGSQTAPIQKWENSSSTTLTSIESDGKVLTTTDMEITGSSNGLILESPDSTRWRVTVDNSGNLTTTSL